jgi:hypothetical protein
MAHDKDPSSPLLGLALLPAALLRLQEVAATYERTREDERAAAELVRRAAADLTPKHRLATMRHRHMLALQRMTEARRALADATARVLVRGHPVDCRCRDCTAEHHVVRPRPQRRRHHG